MYRSILVALAVAAFVNLLCDRTDAAVTHAAKNGFAVEIETTIQGTPAEVYQRLVNDISKWWESSHTYSGEAANLYLEAKPKGWFGERLPQGGSVCHMEVIFVRPGKTLRLRGALGPLQEFAVNGTMSWNLAEVGKGSTKLKLTYYVGGYRPGGLGEFANPVNGVIDTQVQRLKRLVEAEQFP